MTDEATEAAAVKLLGLLGTGRQDGEIAVADMAAAARITARVRALREARGERVVGRKIGFTNTTIWPKYGVDRPMWSYVWDTTLSTAGGGAALDLHGMPEPRIEPEIVLRLAVAPEAGMDEAALLECIDGVAHGFEIVQSVFPGWRFTCAQSAAAFGLHGALAVGPWHPVGADRATWRARLADFDVALRKGAATVATGHARNVLGGPLSALRFLLDTITADPVAPPLQAGEIITTGTLTDAFPVAPGETWSTELHGLPVEGLRLALR